jgi:hypothetical protein
MREAGANLVVENAPQDQVVWPLLAVRRKPKD